MSRTAIVLIHGIGEQRPMETLRSFVSHVITRNFRSKPDQLSELYDSRCLSCKINGQHIDCYELYWAHHMRDSRLCHLLAWLLKLLLISPSELRAMSTHIDYRKVELLGWVLLAFAVAVMVEISLKTWDCLEARPLVVVVIVLLAIVGKSLQSLAQKWLVTIVGDAARYFDSTPDNVQQRQAIRHQCVKFLRTLAESTTPQYDRIVLVGHSLGSVIAYDALKLLWATLPEDAKRLSVSLSRTKAPSRALHLVDQEQWKFSDLVTVGSPLVHAPLLLAGSMETFEDLKEQRELPTCPPQHDPRTGLYGGVKRNSYYLHHAALFAVTRWTNCYLKGDPIGGPLNRLFGKGVKDITLDDGVTHCKWRNHTRYWANGGKAGSAGFREAIGQVLSSGHSDYAFKRDAA